MFCQQLQDLASLHAAELRRFGAAERPASVSTARAGQRRVPNERRGQLAGRPSLRARAGWALVAVGLNLAVCPPATARPRV
jgi:hypothetical protein